MSCWHVRAGSLDELLACACAWPERSFQRAETRRWITGAEETLACACQIDQLAGGGVCLPVRSWRSGCVLACVYWIDQLSGGGVLACPAGTGGAEACWIDQLAGRPEIASSIRTMRDRLGRIRIREDWNVK